MNDKEIKKMAESHWLYVNEVLNNLAIGAAVDGAEIPFWDMMSVVGHHYKTAFIHGFKHGVEAAKSEIQQ